ncbi:hypothetical protein IFU39_16420 [Paenibacillus sp. CFBP 13594]|uniref:hypothetical protein n=1 Tax=Paenibacillus sp. CFBP 13594 TaxID=2774037 RepID=UPI00177E4844|nr:hypothetical protein [Paenibacillus sp. CFBP 13594]MBD8839398.1 hypothetical protein [Paenibacillus sp. CFBP 13594]
MDQFTTLLSLLGATSVIALLGLLIKSVAMVRSSSLEKALMNDSQKITRGVLIITYITLINAIGTSSWLFIIKGSSDWKEGIIFLCINLLLGIFIFTLLLYPLIVKRMYNYYLKFEDKKYYILKSTSSGEIILSKSPNYYTEVILIKREDLYNKTIFQETPTSQ